MDKILTEKEVCELVDSTDYIENKCCTFDKLYDLYIPIKHLSVLATLLITINDIDWDTFSTEGGIFMSGVRWYKRNNKVIIFGEGGTDYKNLNEYNIFNSCNNVIIKNGITVINRGFLLNNLSSINCQISAKNINIAPYAFYNVLLFSCVFNEDVDTIQSYGIYSDPSSAENGTNLTFNKNVNKIESYAICSNEIKFHGTVNYLGDNFAYSNTFTSSGNRVSGIIIFFYDSSTIPIITPNTFNSVRYIYVRKGCLQKYLNEPYWNLFSNKLNEMTV